jgi:hypothetical protein
MEIQIFHHAKILIFRKNPLQETKILQDFFFKFLTYFSEFFAISK